MATMSDAHLVCVRSSLRRRRAWIALALLVGVTGGVLTAAAAGAQRTETVTDRFAEATNSADLMLVAPQCESDACARDFGTALAALPSVSGVAPILSEVFPVRSVDLTLLNPNNDGCASGPGELVIVTEQSATNGINQVQLTEGRLPDPADPTSVLVSQPFTARTGLGLGDELLVYLDASDCVEEEDWSALTRLRIDGIGMMQMEVLPESGYYFEGIHLSAAATEQRTPNVDAQPTWAVDLVVGASTDRFMKEADAAGLVLEAPSGDSADVWMGVAARFRADVTMLNLVAVLGLMCATLVMGAALVREASAMSSDARTLAALGFGPRDQVLVGVAQGAVVGIFAAGLATATAVALSRFMPFGDPRLLEPNPGFHVAPMYLLLGTGLVVVVVVGSFAIGSSLAVRRQLTNTAEPARRGWVARTVALVPALPVTGSTGAHLIAQRSRTTGNAPVRTGLAGIVVAFIGVVGSLTVLSASEHLLQTPRIVGWNWDAMTSTSEDDPRPAEEIRRQLVEDPGVSKAGLAAFIFWQIDVLDPSGEGVLLMSFSTGPDHVEPTIVDGRPAERPNEITVSPFMAQELGISLGESFELESRSDQSDASVTQAYEVVGTAAFGFDTAFAPAAIVTNEGGARLFPPDESLAATVFIIDLEPGATLEEVAARVGIQLDPFFDQTVDSLVQLNVRRSQRSPIALVVVLGFMAFGVLLHLAATAVFRRRHELDILRALGYTTGQVRATVAWMVTILAASTLALSIPIGSILGRAVWLDYANSLFVVRETRYPWAGVALLIIAVLVVANLTGLLASRRSIRSTVRLQPE